MRAHIKPLERYRKYYGTEIEILDGPAKDEIIKIWVSCGKPSTRELDNFHADLKENGCDDSEPYEICDSHYESQLDLDIANAVVKALETIQVN